jgi:hypothetical protein
MMYYANIPPLESIRCFWCEDVVGVVIWTEHVEVRCQEKDYEMRYEEP